MTGLELIPLTKIIFGPYSAPIWAAISGLIVAYINHRSNSKKIKLDGNKDAREDFEVIRDTLYSEINRLNKAQEETNVALLEAEEETKKCEKRYFELAIQYRELLSYCATLAKEFKDLKAYVANISRREDDKTRTNSNNKRSTGE